MKRSRAKLKTKRIFILTNLMQNWKVGDISEEKQSVLNFKIENRAFVGEEGSIIRLIWSHYHFFSFQKESCILIWGHYRFLIPKANLFTHKLNHERTLASLFATLTQITWDRLNVKLSMRKCIDASAGPKEERLFFSTASPLSIVQQKQKGGKVHAFLWTQ